MGVFLSGSPGMVSVKKSTISCSVFFSKNSIIFSRVFFSKLGLEIMFSYGLERKKAFEDDKNFNFFNSKKWVFSKGVHPWLRSKNPDFFLMYFSAI